MSVQRMIIAAVMTKPVFQVFAKMSDGDKAKVTKKVKEKVQGKKDGKGKKAPPIDEEADAPVDAEEETKGKKAPPKKDKGEKVPPKKDKGEDAGAEDSKDAESVKDDAGAEPDEAGGAGDQTVESVVQGLLNEVEAIKSDGQITPAEVLGLVDNMVQMVSILVQAKPPRAKKASRIDIADRVAVSVMRSRRASRSRKADSGDVMMFFNVSEFFKSSEGGMMESWQVEIAQECIENAILSLQRRTSKAVAALLKRSKFVTNAMVDGKLEFK